MVGESTMNNFCFNHGKIVPANEFRYRVLVPQVRIKFFFSRSLKQFVSDPVRLNNPRIKRIANPVLSGDKKQIWIKRSKRLKEYPETRIPPSVIQIIKHFASRIGSAIMKSIRSE